MLVRGHFKERFVQVNFDQPDGVEILAAQVGSILDSEVILLDFAGREVSSDEDIEDLKVVEIEEISDHSEHSRGSLDGSRERTSSVFFEASLMLDDMNQDPSLNVSKACGNDQQSPGSVSISSPRNSRGFSGNKKAVISNAVADLWCCDARLRQVDSFCSSDLLSGEPVIQSRYRIVDTDILLCSHCKSLADPCLVVSETGGPLSSFVCKGRLAADVGLIYPRLDSGGEGNHINSIVTDLELHGPVGIYIKRLLLSLAIESQPFSQLPASFSPAPSQTQSLLSPPVPAGSMATGLLSAPERIEAERTLAAKIRSGAATVWAYEDPHAIAQALAAIDFAVVHQKAQDHLHANPGCSEDVALLFGLLQWFKGGFFTWVSKPPCDNATCPSKRLQSEPGWVASTMESRRTVPPSEEEVRLGKAGRTELYCCSACNSVTRFPRYNDPAHLLNWRRGRCGEFANCFALVCRALSLDTRWVLDFTDHVWVEVWLPSQRRYVHADPCERTFDTPLMYEHGWGKQLTYVVSFSRHGAVDATPRYTRRLAEVLERRGAGGVSERVLGDCIKAIDAELEQRFITSRPRDAASISSLDASKSYLSLDLLADGPEGLKALTRGNESIMTIRRRKRLLSKELWGVTLETRHEWKLEEMRGRISGDRSWKELRGEVGAPLPVSAVFSDPASAIFADPAMARLRERVSFVFLGGGTHGDTTPFDLCEYLWSGLSSFAATKAKEHSELCSGGSQSTGRDDVIGGFDEIVEIRGALRLAEIAIWSGNLVGGIQCTFQGMPPLPPISSNLALGFEDAPVQDSMSFDEGEQIVRIEVRAGALVDGLRIITSSGRELSAGGSGGQLIGYDVPKGMALLGFYGGKGGHIHNLGIILQRF